MFKRIIYENWTLWVPIIAFILTFGVFVFIFVRSVLMKKETADRLAALALEDESPPEPPANDDSSPSN